MTLADALDLTPGKAVTLGRLARNFVYGFLGFPPIRVPVVNRLDLAGYPAVDDPSTYQPTEYAFMATGLVGQFCPLVLKALKDDGSEGTLDGLPSWSFDPPELAELFTSDTGMTFAKLLARGDVTVIVTADADLGEGVRTLEARGQIIINDPAAEEATILELQIGEAVDTPA